MAFLLPAGDYIILEPAATLEPTPTATPDLAAIDFFPQRGYIELQRGALWL